MDKVYDTNEILDVFLQEVKTEFEKCYSILKTRDIIIYGAGGYGRMMIMALASIGMRKNIIAICDSNSEKWGKEIEGIKVCGVDAVDINEKSIIVIASQYEDEIREGLKGSHVEIFNKPVYQNFVEEKLNMYVWKTTTIKAQSQILCDAGFLS